MGGTLVSEGSEPSFSYFAFLDGVCRDVTDRIRKPADTVEESNGFRPGSNL